MGTDRFKIHDGPCACGAGRYVKYRCTPDHPYPTSSVWYQGEISCDACRPVYELAYRDGKVVQFEQSALTEMEAEKEELWKQYVQAKEDVLERARPYLDEF